MSDLAKIKMISSNNHQLKAKVSLDGGILSSLTYRLNNGTQLPILYQAPWLNEHTIQHSPSIPPLLKRLAGEWVGVPFGGVEQDSAFFYANAPHGLPINNQWQWQACTDNSVILSYHYPNDYPLKQITRKITLQDDGCIDLSLSILPRVDCRLPIGLHPIFPFGEQMGPVDIEIPDFDHGITYPKQTEPDVSRAAINQPFRSLSQVPAINGKTINLSHLPLDFDTEEIVQIIRANGLVKLYYHQHNLLVVLKWDKNQLPDCLLWFSHKGRSGAPWLSRNRCLGVEPVCSAWDLGPASMEDNVINQFSPTCLTFLAGKEVTIHYQIYCSPLNKEQQ